MPLFVPIAVGVVTLATGAVVYVAKGSKDEIEEIPEKESFDIIINTVKLYDFDSVLDEIKNKIKNKPLILPFQNGIYAEERLKKKLPGIDTIGAVAQISVFVDENQIIKHVGKLTTHFCRTRCSTQTHWV